MEEEGFQYLPEMIESKLGPRVKGIMINSPSNPTGNVMGKSEWFQITNFSPQIISDEIYHGLVYKGRNTPSSNSRTARLSSTGFRKLYAMTGWRAGVRDCTDRFRPPHAETPAESFYLRELLCTAGGTGRLRKAQKTCRE